MAQTMDIEVKLVGDDMERLRNLAARVEALEGWIEANPLVLDGRVTALETWRAALPEYVTRADVADGRVSLAGRPVVVVPGPTPTQPAPLPDVATAEALRRMVDWIASGDRPEAPAPEPPYTWVEWVRVPLTVPIAQPAPMPGAVADAHAVILIARDRLRGEGCDSTADEYQEIADALAAWYEALPQVADTSIRDARLAALLRRAGEWMYASREPSVRAMWDATVAAAAELYGGDGGGA